MADLLPTNIQALLIESLADLAPMVLSKEHPFVDRIKKEKMGGSAAHIPIVVGYGGGAGGNFATSLTNAQQGAVVDVAYDLKPAVVYGHSTIEWTSQSFTSVAESSALDVATIATKAAMENAVDNFAKAAVFSDGSGALATIKSASNVSGSIWDITLTNIPDAGWFTTGQVLVSAATASSGLDSGSGSVLGSNPIAGIVRTDAGATGWTPTANHIVGLQGQLNGGTNFAGVFGFIPTVANRSNGVPTVSPFNGVTRDATSMVVGVSGWAYDMTGQPLFYGVNQVAGSMSNFKNAKPDLIIANGVDMPKLAQEMDQKVRFDMPSKSGIADILYNGFEVTLSTGRAEVLADPACPAGTVFLTKADQWTLGTPGQPFGPASRGTIMVQDFATNVARFSVACAGYFFTNNPPASAAIKIY